MKTFNLSKETVGKYAKKGCNVLAFTLATVLPYISAKDVKTVIRYMGKVKYDDVVGAIMDSSMFPSDKFKAVELVPRDCDAETYRAIMQVVDSSMYPSDKVKTIESIINKDISQAES